MGRFFLRIIYSICVCALIVSCEKEQNDNDVNNNSVSSFVNIDWDSIPYTHNEENGDISIPKNIDDIKQYSTIVLPESNENPIRIINKISSTNECIILHTSSGTMENLFVDTQFTLSSEPHTKTSKSSPNNCVGNIYYPVKIELTIETPTKSVGTGKTISSSVTKDVIEVLPGTASKTQCQSFRKTLARHVRG